MYEASLTHFDLILLDLDMDQLDGKETARVIRKLEEYSGRHAKIIGVSEQRLDNDLEAIYHESGVDDFISRPFSVADLRGFTERG